MQKGVLAQGRENPQISNNLTLLIGEIEQSFKKTQNKYTVVGN